MHKSHAILRDTYQITPQIKMFSINSIRHIFFCITVIFWMAYAVNSVPLRHGDGHEYSLISQAVINHYSVDVRADDITSRQNQLLKYPSQGYVPELFEKIKLCISTKKCNEHGLFLSKNDNYYGYHFWLYPAYAAIVELFLVFLGLNPLAGFQLANVLLLIAVVGFCLYFTSISLMRQIAASLVFMLGGVIFYIKWTHPEVFVAAFIYVGFILIFERKIIYSIPFFSLAAIQVVTIWPLLMIVPISLYLLNGMRVREQFNTLLKNWWLVVFAMMPVISLLFYKYNYGVISLIGTAHTNVDLITISHLLSTWIDLNQGFLVGAPWFLVLIVVFLSRINRFRESPKFICA